MVSDDEILNAAHKMLRRINAGTVSEAAGGAEFARELRALATPKIVSYRGIGNRLQRFDTEADKWVDAGEIPAPPMPPAMAALADRLEASENPEASLNFDKPLEGA